MAEFKKLSEVEMLESTSYNTTVLVEDSGEIKRVAKSKVGGAGGYVATITTDDLEMSTSDIIFVSENYDALYDVLNAGGNAWVDLSVMNSMTPTSVMSGSGSDMPAFPSIFGKELCLIFNWAITDAGLIGGIMRQGNPVAVMFPNGSHNLEQPENDS